MTNGLRFSSYLFQIMNVWDNDGFISDIAKAVEMQMLQLHFAVRTCRTERATVTTRATVRFLLAIHSRCRSQALTTI